MSNDVMGKAMAAPARVGVTEIAQAPPPHGVLPPQPKEPLLDGRIAIGHAENEDGYYTFMFEPYAACDDRDGNPQKAGQYYYAGYVFNDAYQIRMENRVGYKGTGHGSFVEFTKRPINVAEVKQMFHIWRLDDLGDISWKYLACPKGKERSIFHMPGDASWSELQHVLEIEELDARIGKAMRSLGEKMRWNQYTYLDTPHEMYEVTKRSRAFVAKARIRVEKKEAQAAKALAARAKARLEQKQKAVD